MAASVSTSSLSPAEETKKTLTCDTTQWLESDLETSAIREFIPDADLGGSGDGSHRLERAKAEGRAPIGTSEASNCGLELAPFGWLPRC